jgi:hypothetical protein
LLKKKYQCPALAFHVVIGVGFEGGAWLGVGMKADAAYVAIPSSDISFWYPTGMDGVPFLQYPARHSGIYKKLYEGCKAY